MPWIRHALTLATSLAASAPAVAFAKKAAEAPEAPKGGSWTLPYMLVVMAVALGLVVILRPGTRKGWDEN